MNQHVNRRNLVSGSAAVAVSLGAVPAFAKAKKFQRSKFDELEAAFTTAHDKLIAMGEAHSAAEGRYRDERVKLAKPTFREAQPMGREEREALMRMTLAEIRDGTSCRDDYEERKREYEAEMQAYDEAVEAIRRKVFDKIDRAYNRQVDRVTKAADAVLEQPAETLDDLAVKVRVQRTWWGDFEDDSVTSILDDVIRLAGKSQSSSSIN